MKDLILQLKNELAFIQRLVEQIEDFEKTPPFVPDPPDKLQEILKQTENYIDGGTL